MTGCVLLLARLVHSAGEVTRRDDHGKIQQKAEFRRRQCPEENEASRYRGHETSPGRPWRRPETQSQEEHQKGIPQGRSAQDGAARSAQGRQQEASDRAQEIRQESGQENRKENCKENCKEGRAQEGQVRQASRRQESGSVREPPGSASACCAPHRAGRGRTSSDARRSPVDTGTGRTSRNLGSGPPSGDSAVRSAPGSTVSRCPSCHTSTAPGSPGTNCTAGSPGTDCTAGSPGARLAPAGPACSSGSAFLVDVVFGSAPNADTAWWWNVSRRYIVRAAAAGSELYAGSTGCAATGLFASHAWGLERQRRR
jgi:hypothetical protein